MLLLVMCCVCLTYEGKRIKDLQNNAEKSKQDTHIHIHLIIYWEWGQQYEIFMYEYQAAKFI